MTSSNGIIFRATGPLWGKFIGPRWLPITRPLSQTFYVFFDLRLNKRLSKPSRCRLLEMSSRSLWRHFNDIFLLTSLFVDTHYLTRKEIYLINSDFNTKHIYFANACMAVTVKYIYKCTKWHGPLAKYVKLRVCMRRECQERFPRRSG